MGGMVLPLPAASRCSRSMQSWLFCLNSLPSKLSLDLTPVPGRAIMPPVSICVYTHVVCQMRAENMILPGWAFGVAILFLIVGLLGVLLPAVPGVGFMWIVILVYAIAERFATIDPLSFAMLTVLG